MTSNCTKHFRQKEVAIAQIPNFYPPTLLKIKVTILTHLFTLHTLLYCRTERH